MIKNIFYATLNHQMKDFVIGEMTFLMILIGWLINFRHFYFLVADGMYHQVLLSTFKVSLIIETKMNNI